MSLSIRRVVMSPEPLEDLNTTQQTQYKKGQEGDGCPLCNKEFEKLNFELVQSVDGSLTYALKATCSDYDATASLKGDALARILASILAIRDAGSYAAPPEPKPKRHGWFW